MIIRVLLILFGVWLVTRVWRLFAGLRPGMPSEIEREEPPEEKSAFHDTSIQDGEFEEVDKRQKRGGEGS